jgi:PhnB protein
MSITPNYVPRQYKTISIQLVVKDAHKALAFYNSAFGAETIMLLEDPHGKVVHAEMQIEDIVLMLSEEDPYINQSPATLGGTGVVIQLYTGSAEGVFEAAIRAGAEEIFPIKEQFYGDRAGRVKDPFGHHWIIATHIEDVPPKELQKRFNELYI